MYKLFLGTSDDGNTCRKFFSDEMMLIILSLIKTESPEEMEIWRKKLQYSQVIMRVVNSSQKINLIAFDAYLFEAYIFQLKNFPYATMVQTIHRNWGHCIELMKELWVMV